MNRKRNVLVSSTPHPERTRQLVSLFENMDFSPIVEPCQLKGSIGIPDKVASTNPSASVNTRAARKRRVVNKKEAASEHVAAGILKELGVDPKEVCNPALSHSRNLYNMFPEPIILDSDSEESSVSKPPKKPKQESTIKLSKQESKIKSSMQESKIKLAKQDSKVVQSNLLKNGEDKKPNEHVPGSSRITRLTRLTADRKEKKPTSKTNDAISVAKGSKTKRNCVKKPSSPHDSTSSVLIVDVDTNDNDNLFDGCQPSTSVYQSPKVNKASKNVRLSSLDLDEKFPIQWSGRKNKTKPSENVPELEDVNKDNNENIQTRSKKTADSKAVCKHAFVSEENLNDLKPLNNINANVKGDQINQEKENIGKNKKDVAKTHIKKEATITGKSKNTILNDLTSKESRNANDCKKQVSNGEDKSQVLVSRFEEVVFKVSNASGGIIAKCLRTDNNDIGYLEVVPEQVFNGQSANITFVVIEGKAKVLHLGTQQILSPGDMIHISSDSGYQFESAEKGHVRFLYIKVH